MKNTSDEDSNVQAVLDGISSLGQLKKFMKATGSKFKLTGTYAGEGGFQQQVSRSKKGNFAQYKEMMISFIVPEFKMNAISLEEEMKPGDLGGEFEFNVASLWFDKETKRVVPEPEWFKQLKASKEQ